MQTSTLLLLLSTALLTVYLGTTSVKSCNEAACLSVVSKCLLIQACMCTPNDLTCYKGCFDCLGDYASECCSCLHICPQPDNTQKLNEQSQVEDFPETSPGLFRVLTEYPDDKDRWTAVTFPIHIDVSQYGQNSELKFYMQTTTTLAPPVEANLLTIDCTVIFMTECVSWPKCKKNCKAMGASSYRWFHDGCCECVGDHCIYHGLNTSRCANCPLKEMSESEQDYEYGDYDDDDDYEEG